MSNSAVSLLSLWLSTTVPTHLGIASAGARTLQDSPTDPEEQIRYLAGLVEKGLHDLAVQEARAFLRAHARHAGASRVRYRLATALWELERREEAGREYEALAKLEGFEFRAEALFRCGEAARARGDVARERAAFEGVLSTGQDYLRSPALLALADLESRNGRSTEAEQRYAELLEAHPDSAEAPLARKGLVWCALEREDAAEASVRARRFLAKEPEGLHADELRLLLGEALLDNDPAAALEAFHAIRTGSNSTGSIKSEELAESRQRGVGFALSALGRQREAAEAFEVLLTRNPEGPHAREAALQAGIARLRAADARAAVRRLSAIDEPDGETLYWLAQAQRAAGDGEAALATLEQAARERPTGELAQRIAVLQGDCWMALGRPAEARAAYQASGSALALHAAAVAALNQGDEEEALRLAETLLAGAPDPRDPAVQGARVVRAEALFAARRYADAERALDVALEDPADPAEALRLASRAAWCRYLAGDLATARARFQALAERGGDGGGDGGGDSEECEEALAMLVRIAEEEGSPDPEAARRYLERHPRGRFADAAALALARGAPEGERRARLAEWLERFPQSSARIAAQLELAELESAAGEPARAALRYQEVLNEAGGTGAAASAAYGIAWSAWEREDFPGCERALAVLAENAEADESLREAGLELGIWSRVARGALDEGIALWRELARAGSEERRASSARRIAAALKDEGRAEDAEQLLVECQRAVRSAPLAAELHVERAYLALDRADLGAADTLLRQARKAGAGAALVAEATFHLGEARLAAGDSGGALAAFAGAAATDHPRAADALYKLGFTHLAQGELDEAEQALLRVLEEHPESELANEARFLCGECAFRRGDHAEAARRLEAARAGGASRGATGELLARVLFRLGLSLGHLGRWGECDAALTELARAFPSFANLAEGELWRGRALLAQGKTRAARAALERTLALDPGELAAGARLELGRLAEGEGRLDDALSEYLKVALLYAHEEPVSEALLAAGRVLEAQGAREQAVARYRELLAEHASSPPAARARERLKALGER